MATRLPGTPGTRFRTTDHNDEIKRLRGGSLQRREIPALSAALAADLLEAHDDTGISLDSWPIARAFVEHWLGQPILENGV